MIDIGITDFQSADLHKMGQVTKTCLMPYANNRGADQPAHPHSLLQGCKNAGKYAYFPCHWHLPAFMAFMANMVANMAYMVNSMDSYQI